MLPLLRTRARLRHARARLGTRLTGAFFGPVVTLVSGAVAAQAFTFAARPFLTRLYTPDEFGALTLFVTLIALFGALVTGHYDDAQMLPANRRDAAGLLLLALGSATVGSLLLVLALPWRSDVATLLDTPALGPALLLLPLGLLLLAWGQALEGWHTRHDRFRLVSGGRISQSSVLVATQIGAGVMGVGVVGLTGGAVLGFAALLVVAGLPLLTRDHAVLRKAARPDALRTLAVRYRRFPLFSTPAAFLNLLSGRIPVLLLATFFGSSVVGLFGLAFGTLAMPVGVVTGAVSQVFGVRAPAAHREAALGALTRQVHRRLVAVALFPMAACALAGPDLFAFVFGEPWREAGAFARLLAPWLFAASIAMPLTRVFDVTEQQRSDFGFSVLLFGVQVLTLTSVYLVGGNPRAAIGAISIAGTLSRIAQIAWMLHLAGASRRRAAMDLLRHLGYAVPGLLPAVVVMALTPSPLLLLLALGLGAVGYLVLAARADRRFCDPSA